MTNVYILNSDPDHYQAFGVINEDDLDRKLDGFRGEPMARDWLPMGIKSHDENPNNTQPVGDFPTFGRVPVFSARAVRELVDLLDGRGELLPLVTDQGEFYAFNVTRLSDALDEEHSSFERFDDGNVMDIETYAFAPERLTGETIFKLPPVVPMYEYVTDVFVDRVSERDLQGFLFQQVWPHAVD
jgi:hypothetical protein